MQLTDHNNIRNILQKYNFNFKKSLGQNFLVNPTVCPKMARLAAPDKSYGVIEIGPGIGVLTKELSALAAKTVAVEIDERLKPVLADTLSECNNVKVVFGDVCKIDLHELIRKEFEGIKVSVCANLPYYITSNIIMTLLENRLPIESVTVMVQKEAADRLCAPPGSRECGAVSAAVHYYSIPEKIFKVSPGSFIPQPKVDSEVIRLNIRKKPAVDVSSPDKMFALIKAAFAQRRKTFANSVSAVIGIGKDYINAVLTDLSIPVTVRAERLTLEDFARISERIENLFADGSNK